MAPKKPQLNPATGRSRRSRKILAESIPSQTAAIEPLVDRILGELGRLVSVDGHRDALDLALREALVNAVVHGNQNDPARQVHVECFQMADGSILLVVRDQGSGFDPDGVMDPTVPENLTRATGRGIFLIRKFMDEVEFVKGGREIRMKKKVSR
jgi:serine/threonine-protein kinase RsbW